jgi:hypothetical protein
MDISTTKTLINNQYGATIETALSPREVTFCDQYGEPTVDVGGEFTYQSGSPLVDHTFTVTGQQRGIRSGFPASYSVSGGDADAAKKRDAWAAEINVRLADAKTTLMAKPAVVSPSTVITSV